MNAPRARRFRFSAVAAIALAVVLAGCTTHSATAISAFDLWQAQQFKEFTVYWAGRDVGGVKLTAADNLSNFVSSSIGITLYYGDCEGRGPLHTAGCTLPLTITTVRYSPHSDSTFGPLVWTELRGVPAVVYHGGQNIEMYTFHEAVDINADSKGRALAAVRALEPFNRKASRYFPAFPAPLFKPGLSWAQLDALAATGPSGATGANGASGASGATGPTSSLRPPPALEPTPSNG